MLRHYSFVFVDLRIFKKLQQLSVVIDSEKNVRKQWINEWKSQTEPSQFIYIVILGFLVLAVVSAIDAQRGRGPSVGGQGIQISGRGKAAASLPAQSIPDSDT